MQIDSLISDGFPAMRGDVIFWKARIPYKRSNDSNTKEGSLTRIDEVLIFLFYVSIYKFSCLQKE